MFDWRVFCVFFLNTCSYYLDPEKILVPDWLRMERIELLVGGFEHVLFFHSVGNFIIPTDELIFFRGVGQPPTRICREQIPYNRRFDQQVWGLIVEFR